MKKLNITKEQFNRSRYFQRKYGELEYVSESGKMFKTNKGEVLRFKESRTSNWEEVDIVWNSDTDLLPDTIFVQVNQGSPSEIDLKYELEKRYDAEIIDLDTYPVSDIDSLCDCFKWTGDKLKPLNPSRITGKELQANWESTKESTRRARRSARRFNESHLMNEMDSGFEGGVPKRGGIGKYDPGPSYDDVPHKTKKPKKGTKKPTPLTVGELLDIIEADNIPDDAIVCGGSFIGVRVADELTSEFSCYDEEKNRFELANLRAAQKELGF